MNKEKSIRVILTIVIVCVIAILWYQESDLAYNVAQQRVILLGRYTLEKTIALLIATPILLCVLRGIWKTKKEIKDSQAKRQTTFKLICVSISILIAVIFVDVTMRLARQKTYVGDAQSYHRTPNRVFRGVFQDHPEAAFSYPNALPGHPDVPYVLTVDKHGFRNPIENDHYDWIALGDSFTEGSGVSDDQVWTTLLAKRKGIRLYNLGMSGGNPITYLDTLKKFGVSMQPKVALYMLYEGNDLRDSNFQQHKLDAPREATLYDKVFKASPSRKLIQDSLVRFLGPIGKNRYIKDPDVHNPSHQMYPVAWLPFETPVGSGYSYAFDLKRLEQHYLTEVSFRKSIACTESLRLLEETKQVCDKNSITLIVIYAPDTPHTLFDQIASRVDPKQLHAFMAMRLKNPPSPEALVSALREGVAARQRILEQFCAERNITFISLTEILQQKILQGHQVYYTYDQHWTPEGHQVVAEFLSEQIASPKEP